MGRHVDKIIQAELLKAKSGKVAPDKKTDEIEAKIGTFEETLEKACAKIAELETKLEELTVKVDGLKKPAKTK